MTNWGSTKLSLNFSSIDRNLFFQNQPSISQSYLLIKYLDSFLLEAKCCKFYWANIKRCNQSNLPSLDFLVSRPWRFQTNSSPYICTSMLRFSMSRQIDKKFVWKFWGVGDLWSELGDCRIAASGGCWNGKEKVTRWRWKRERLVGLEFSYYKNVIAFWIFGINARRLIFLT